MEQRIEIETKFDDACEHMERIMWTNVKSFAMMMMN